MAPAPFISAKPVNNFSQHSGVSLKALHLSHVSTDLRLEPSECLKNSFSAESTHEMCFEIDLKEGILSQGNIASA